MKEYEKLSKCVSAGMQMARDHDSYRGDSSSPVIFRENVRGLVTEDDLKVNYSDLSQHMKAEGKDIVCYMLTCNSAIAIYDKEGACGVIHGGKNEVLSQKLIDLTEKMWMKDKCIKPVLETQAAPHKITSIRVRRNK